ncbi:MAG: D-aminoacylase [Chloroflexota bacterium]
MFDLLIENGLVIDGTGNVGFRGSVGISGDTLTVLRGDVSHVQAARRIDATGQVISPGFIDVHAHSGLVMLAEPRHEPKVRQGVTTELIGIDGNSYAPFRTPEDLTAFIRLNSGLDGDPELPGTWSTVAEYLAMFDRRVAVNVCYILGNSPLRIATVGWENRPATETEIADMRSLLREGMEEGAYGLSTGLDYPPGNYADTAELVELASVAGRLGGIYHSHVRNRLGDGYLDPFRECIEIGRRGELPAHITHFYLRANQQAGGADRMLALVEDARTAGLDVTFDSYPYIFSGTRLLILFPDWAHEGGPERLKAILRSAEGRARLRQDVQPRGLNWQDQWLTYFKRPENHQYEGCSIAEVAAMRQQHPVDAMCDLLLEEDLRISFVTAGGSWMTLPKFVAHPCSMVGSDAVLLGDFPSPRTYGCFPIILAEYVRENGYMSLPEAIRKMTSFPAQRLGIPDRGLLRDGFKADVVVFNAAEVRAPATRQQPKQFPIGIEYVIVNGRIVVENGEHTGVLAGRALRRGRASS